MFPPFFVTDHRVGPDDPTPFESKRHIRRNRPEPLRLTLPASGAPMVHVQPVRPPEPLAAPADTASPGRRGWLLRLILWRQPA